MKFYEYHVLDDNGSISREEVDEFVKKEYEKFKPIQDKLFQSDYDRFDAETRNCLNNHLGSCNGCSFMRWSKK